MDFIEKEVAIRTNRTSKIFDCNGELPKGLHEMVMYILWEVLE
jgi:hypothetical protein